MSRRVFTAALTDRGSSMEVDFLFNSLGHENSTLLFKFAATVSQSGGRVRRSRFTWNSLIGLNMKHPNIYLYHPNWDKTC